MTLTLADPAQMIAQGAPRMIRSDADLQEYTDALFHLTALDQPSDAEVEAIDLLSLLIERYEQDRYPLPDADPVSVLKFLIQQHELSQRDLVPEFGTESAVSMFLTGRRRLSLGQLSRLSARFSVPADVFLATKSQKK